MNSNFAIFLLTVLRGGNSVPPPTAPSGLTATVISTSRIDLAWTDNADNETEQRIYRSTDGVSYSLIDTIAADLETYSDTTITAGVYYRYKVGAANVGGEALSDAAESVITALDQLPGLVAWYDASDLTTQLQASGGATVTVNSTTGGKRSWIHIVGVEAGTATIPRLGSFTVDGDWYELGETNGSDDQTFQFPVADACPAIWVETSAGSGVYEIWLNGGSRWGTATAYIAQDVRGKFFGMDNTTGVITIARRASNACGYKPSSGCKVRIPNVIFSSTTSADYNANTLNATLATRYDFTTTSAGTITIQYASMNWYPSFTSAFDVTLTHVGILHAAVFSTIASEVTLTDVAFGLNSTLDTVPLSFTNMFSGIEMTDVRMVKYASAAATNVCVFTDCAEVVLDGCQFEIFGNTSAVTRGNAAIECLYLTRVFGLEATDMVLIGGRARITSCSDVTFTDTLYADAEIGSTTTTNGLYAFLAEIAATAIMIDGFANFGEIANVHPYLGIVNTATGVNTIRFRNLATAASPYNAGSANAAWCTGSD